MSVGTCIYVSESVCEYVYTCVYTCVREREGVVSVCVYVCVVSVWVPYTTPT